MCDCVTYSACCKHENLKYNKCCDTVECEDCGSTWSRQWTTLPTVPYSPQYEWSYTIYNDDGTAKDMN